MEIRILLCMCFALFFFGNWLIPITDPTENCYALTVKEMIEAGDYLSPRIYGNFWFDKPIFFYWEAILGCKLFGINEFGLRFFPALFSTATVLLTYKESPLGALVLCTSVWSWFVAHSVITDASLNFFVAACCFAPAPSSLPSLSPRLPSVRLAFFVSQLYRLVKAKVFDRYATLTSPINNH